MIDLSRRTFLRRASLGAAGAGVLATSGTVLFSTVGSAEASPSPLGQPVVGAVPSSAATDIFAHVSDASKGEVTVFHGTQAYVVTDPALAHALAQVIS